jgi:DNA-binding transcriptional MerR regulator
MNAFTIKDLENLSGIKAHTIRIWEQRYNFLKPQRTDTNIRYYSNNDLKLILNIALLNKYGIKISHIDKMNEDEIKNKILSLNDELAKEERIVNLLIQSMVDLDMDKFEEIIDDYLQLHPFEKIVTQIFFPFLDRIGILWLTNHINPAHEHLVSNIIRQKLITGIENEGREMKDAKTALLFLPEDDHHELGLLYSYYLLRKRGVKVIYLGATVPIRDLEYIVNRKTPDFAYSHITTFASNFNFEKFLTQLHHRIPKLPFIISGQVTQNYRKNIPENVSFKKSLLEVNTFISSI